MINLPENKDLWTQEQWREAAEQVVLEKLKDPTYKNSVLARIIEKQMVSDALSCLSDIAGRERCKRAEAQRIEEHSAPYNCLCSKIKELFK